MNLQDFRKVTVSKLSNLNINELKEVVISMSNNFDKASDTITDVALDLLSSIMSEDDFNSFCDEY